MAYSINTVYLEQFGRRSMAWVRDVFTFGYTEFVTSVQCPGGITE